MKVSILGAGSIGLAYTSLLSHAGHEVAMLSPSGKSTQALSDGQTLQSTAPFPAPPSTDPKVQHVALVNFDGSGSRRDLGSSSVHRHDVQCITIDLINFFIIKRQYQAEI